MLNLNIFHQNVQSLKNKLLTIDVFLHSMQIQPNVLCFSEHWCSSSELKAANFSGFVLGSYFCRQSKKNGGACIYVADGISFTNREDIVKLGEELNFEAAAIQIHETVNSEKVIVICIYRSPNGDKNIFLSKLELLLYFLHQEKAKLFLCGDINIDLHEKSHFKYTYINILNSAGMISIVNTPTRETTNSKSVIDHIFVNVKTSNIKVAVVKNGLSDHHGQLAQLENIKLFQNIIHTFKRNFSSLNCQLFGERLRTVDWVNIKTGNTVNECFRNFMNSLCSLFEESFPKKIYVLKSQAVSNKSWITIGIKTSSRKLKTLYSIGKFNKSPHFVEYYTTYKKIYKKVLFRAKQMHNDKLILNSNNKGKTMWNVIKIETNRSTNTSKDVKIKDDNGKMIQEPEFTAEYINNFFLSVASNISKSYLHQSKTQIPQAVSSSLMLFPVTAKEVYDCIKTLKNTNSVGMDEIPTKIIKTYAHSLLQPLVYIINQSFSSGIFPDDLKVAKVIPLHKTGDINNINNYRPISILTIISKIFEKLMKQRLVHYLEKHKLLNSFQHGFTKGKSTESAIAEFTQHIHEALDSKKRTIGIFLDLSKAFDSVNHSILLDKLNALGIRGVVNNWFKSYLHNRTQLTEITTTNNHNYRERYHSSLKKCADIGVPQGSILGPILFLIYVNDLGKCVPYGEIISYADDTNYLISSMDNNTLELKLNELLIEINKWFSSNHLTLNVDKTKLIQFFLKKKPNKVNAKVHDTDIEGVEKTKFLGVVIDEKLSWKHHIQLLSNKLSSACYLLRILAGKCSLQCSRSAYYAYVHSTINYGIIFWGINKHNRSKIFRIQKRAVRIILHKHPNTHCKPLFKDLRILPTPCIYIYNSILYIKKNLHLPSYQLNNQIHYHNTRKKCDIHIHQVNTSQALQSVHNNGVKFYNNLPDHLKIISNYKTFRNTLFDFLIDKCYYEVDDFFER